jgi:hypothetical protein
LLIGGPEEISGVRRVICGSIATADSAGDDRREMCVADEFGGFVARKAVL